MIGRWGSAAVQGYVREAHLKKAESWAQKLNESASLEKLIEEITNKVKANLEESDLWKATLREASKVAGKAEDKATVEALALAAVAKVAPQKLDRVVSSEGVVHQVMLGPPEVALDVAASVCGWKFGGRSSASLVSSEGARVVYKRMCARCFGEARESLKGELAEEVCKLGL